MSLSSRERVVVSLAPGRLGLRRFARKGNQLLDQHSVPFPAIGGTPWTGGIEALELLLDEPAWAGRDMTVLLSSHYVRYAVMPAGERLGMAERVDLARLVFRKIYGDIAADWQMRVSPSGRRPTVACGVPGALLDGLRTASEGRAALTSIQPLLMAVFNASRRVMAGGNGVLAIVEPGRITLATIENGDWRSIASRAAEAHDLPELLAEERGLAGAPAGGTLWLWDPGGQAAVPDSADWRIERLPGGWEAE